MVKKQESTDSVWPMHIVTTHGFCGLMSVKGPQLALYDIAGGGAGLGGLGGLGAGGLGGGAGGLGGGGLGDGGGGLGGGGDIGLMAVTIGRPLFCMYTTNASGKTDGTTDRNEFMCAVAMLCCMS